MKTKKEIIEFLFFIAVFLVSLQSLYLFSINIPIYSVFGVLLLIFLSLFCKRSIYLSNKFSYSNNFRLEKVVPLILVLISSFGAVFYGKIDLFRILSIILICSIAFSYAKISIYINPLNIIYKVVFVHSFVFIAQFILFYGFSIEIDPVSIFSESQQTGWGGLQEHEVLGKFRRLGGLYKEPGTFATFLAPLVGVLFIKSESKAHSYVSYFGLLSIFLTFSIYAWVFSIILFAIKFYRTKTAIMLMLPALFIGIQLALPYVQYRFLDRADASGLDDRIEIINNIIGFNFSNFTYFMFGSGLFTVEIPFDYDSAINDVGLIFYSLLNLGIIGLFLITIFILSSVWKLKIPGIFLGCMILVSKISLFAPMFWIIILLMRHTTYTIDKTKDGKI